MAAVTERELIDAARAGEQDAFTALVEPRRGELRAHCYRMLGSAADAEDTLQETLLRAWRAIGRFEGRSSLRVWLFRIATNACLRAIARRPPRVLPLDLGGPSDPHGEVPERDPEIPWLQPMPDALLGLDAGPIGPEARYELRESVELAFVAALQHLPARQRAVLVLRDVLGFSAAEVAELLETTSASVNSALQRAHATVDDRLPASSQQATLRALGDPALRELVGAYVQAWEDGDVEALAALLTDDVQLTMPPIPGWYRGREDVSTFLGLRPLAHPEARRAYPTFANGQPAIVGEAWSDEHHAFVASNVAVLTLRGDRIAGYHAFLDDRDVARIAEAT